MMVNEWLAVAMFASFIVLVFTGFPVAWVLAGVGVAFTGIAYWTDSMGWTLTGLDYNTLGLLTGRIFGIMDNWVLVALPMFIFMGLMLDKSGVAERMMHSMQKLFGNVKGGLAITVTLKSDAAARAESFLPMFDFPTMMISGWGNTGSIRTSRVPLL